MRNAEGRDFTAVGRYRGIDPPNRVSYTWDLKEGEYQVGETVIMVDFRPVDGGTEVVMRHELLPTAEAAAEHTKGWTSCLNRPEGMFPGS